VKQVQKGEGKFLGGFTRFGFTVKEEKLIPDPEQQAIIKEMKGMRRRGMSLRRISKWLDRTYGVPPLALFLTKVKHIQPLNFRL